MITSFTYQPSLAVTVSAPNSSGISRVFAAAVVNQQFRELLLRDPHEALQNGYLGESFSLSPEEHGLIVSIRADSLSDLAKQVNKALSSQY